MTHTTYCAYCTYRRAVGMLHIHQAGTNQHAPACRSCAQEARDHYGRRARLTSWPTR